jgi:hypothetical protein
MNSKLLNCRTDRAFVFHPVERLESGDNSLALWERERVRVKRADYD